MSFFLSVLFEVIWANVCRFVRGEVAEYVWWCDARGESVFVFAADGDAGVVS